MIVIKSKNPDEYGEASPLPEKGSGISNISSAAELVPVQIVIKHAGLQEFAMRANRQDVPIFKKPQSDRRFR